jgi:hypothetical protein
VKEIVKNLVVICPAFCGKMRRLPDKKSRVFVVLLKFDYWKVVLLHELGKLPVKFVASRARNTGVIVKVAA